MNITFFLRQMIFAGLVLPSLFFSAEAIAQSGFSAPVAISIPDSSESPGITLQFSSWKFSPYDSTQFADAGYDDGNWELRKSIFDLKENKDHPYPAVSWFRNTFKADSSMLDQAYYILMLQDGASELYLDGKLLLRTGKIAGKKASLYRNSRGKPAIFVIKDTGTHVFAVRYADYEAPGYIRSDPDKEYGFHMVTEPAQQYLSTTVRNVSIASSVSLFVCGVFVALSLLHLLMYLFYRSALYNIYFSFYNFSIALGSYLIYLQLTSDRPDFLRYSPLMMFVSFSLFSISLTGFINDLFSKRKKRFYILLIIWSAIVLTAFISMTSAFALIFFFLMFVIAESFIVVIKAMVRKEHAAFIVGAGILLFALFIVLGILFSMVKPNGSDSWVGRSFLVFGAVILVSFPLSISAYLAWRFGAANKNLEKKLIQVEELSQQTREQELEKQAILLNQKERLEQEVAERTSELLTEKQKSDDLLLNILPQEVAEELKQKGESKAQKFDEVSVLFTDFVNFTVVAGTLLPEDLLQELNIHFTAFDKIMERHGMEKIKTIGDAYLAVSGVPVKNERHAHNAIAAAIEIQDFVAKRKATTHNGFEIRMGINSGSLVAGIVGVKKFAYDIWGDTVNIAARMEQNSQPGRINISHHTYQLVKDEYDCEYRGRISAKGKGEMDMYFVNKHTL